MEIKRLRGPAIGRNQAVAYGGLVWTVGTAGSAGLDLPEQTREALRVIEQSLIELGSDKTRLLSTQIFLTDMSRKAEMDEVWNKWIGPDPNHWPQRACVGAPLTGDLLVEITVVATTK